MKPWLKEIPHQQDLLGGLICPICKQDKSHLVSMMFLEGMSCICEDCRQKTTFADAIRPPKMKEFARRVSGAT